MLENYFSQLYQSSSGDCRQTTPPDGFNFPLPSSGITGGINIKEVKTIIMEQNSIYPPTYNAVFLPVPADL
ncbi:Ras guanine nucleotide exchange factor [Bacteroides helcogenes P 36-108]|uniref:Ras guanine nucleotide exchange factor n=1 Tax=Bacteroides helcogenes (strain ATCC 35417 / DSM 20613 / JCM 6297 / CCUG 15421 / P 36-108) TaxID=693979 RepID=E6SP27_BACT6|nr:Ras guanine nucleotide exchange factor [Bacteroides helcogenes P 36-108]